MRSLLMILAILPLAHSQCANGATRLGACIGGLCPAGYTCDATGTNCCQSSPVVPPNPPVVPPNPPVVPPNPPNPGGGGGGGACTDTYGQLCTRFSQYCNVYPFSVCMQSNCAQTCGTCGTAAAARGGSGYGGFGSLFGFGSRNGYGFGGRYGYGR